MFLFDENYVKSMNQLLDENVFSDKIGFSKIISEIKKGNTQAVNGLKELVFKVYRDSPEDLASDLPSIAEIVRLTIVAGIPATIHPALSIFTLIVDRVIKDKANAKVIDRYIKKYEKEVEKMTNKVYNCKNPKQKKYLQEELNSLENGLTNLMSYKDKLEDENNTIITKRMKDMNSNLEEAVNLMLDEYLILTEEQKLVLFSDEEFLSEGVIDKVKVMKHDIGKKVDSMDKWFQDTARTIKYGIQNNKRSEIVEGDFFPKVSKMVKRAIVLGVVWAINPAIAAIGAVSAFVLSKKGTENQRKKVLRDIKNELELVEEKIKDADSNNDKKQKYQLIRLRQKLQNEKDRIQRRV